MERENHCRLGTRTKRKSLERPLRWMPPIYLPMLICDMLFFSSLRPSIFSSLSGCRSNIFLSSCSKFWPRTNTILLKSVGGDPGGGISHSQ